MTLAECEEKINSLYDWRFSGEDRIYREAVSRGVIGASLDQNNALFDGVREEFNKRYAEIMNGLVATNG